MRALSICLCVLIVFLASPPAAAQGVVASGVVTAASLNLRQAPSMDGEVVDIYAKGAKVEVLEILDEWVYVRAGDGNTGYMAAQYISLADVVPTAPKYTAGSVQEAGEPRTYEVSEQGITLSIAYPLLESESANSHLDEWLRNTLYAARLLEESSVGIVARYDAHLVEDRYIGVLELGTMQSPSLGETALLFTLNVDQATGKVLSYKHIFTAGRVDEVLDLLKERLSRESGDDDWLLMPDVLQNTLLTGSGVTVFVPVAGSSSPYQITLSYKMLHDNGLLALEMNLPATREIDPTRPMVALTFDDGPGVYTDLILDTLAFYGVKATFYVVGNRCQNFKTQLARTAEEGHEIGTHTWSHKKLTELSSSDIGKELRQGVSAITNIADVEVTTFRPPYGSYNKEVRDTARRMDLSVILWNIDTEDWRTDDADETYRRIMEGVKPGCIILCHEIKESAPAATEKVIPALLEQGYQFVTVSELLSFTEGGAVPGSVYT